MTFSDKKLSIFQRGLLQKIVALALASAFGFIIDWIDKQWFISIEEEKKNLAEKTKNLARTKRPNCACRTCTTDSESKL